MIQKNNVNINSIEEWGKIAGPKEKIQWKEYRSAFESAYAWFREGSAKLPEEIRLLLEENDNFGSFYVNKVEPEALIRFDNFRGPSNMDVLVFGEDEKGPIIVCIEAKADEPFSSILKDSFKKAQQYLKKSPNSKAVLRIQQLVESLLGKKWNELTFEKELRYQLFTGLAGTIAKTIAKGCNRGVFLIHEFNTPLTNHELHVRNENDLNVFIKTITTGLITEIKSGQLVGPISISGSPLFKTIPEIFIGKVTVNIEERI